MAKVSCRLSVRVCGSLVLPFWPNNRTWELERLLLFRDVINPKRLYQWIAVIRRVRLMYLSHLGRKPRLYRPTRFSEKIQWRKLFDLNPIYTVLSDKLTVREFVAERVGAEMLIPLLWVGNDPDSLPFETNQGC